MMRSFRLFATCSLALIAACGAGTTPTDSGRADVRSDTLSTTDGSGADAALEDRVDLDSPSSDTGVGADVPSPIDTGVGADVPSPSDTGVGADVPSATDTGVGGGCRSNAECAGAACLGIPACGGAGRCGPVRLCSRIFDPVCGCDGMTYSNDCVADNAGVGVRARGACATVADSGVTTCRSNAECGGRLACLGIPACGGSGTCSAMRPCPDVIDPVCGCDGRTYGNACEADNAGVGVRSRGACAGPTMCRSNADCAGARETCQGIATCGGTGMCRTPGPCPLVIDPVCGCDGRTYDNACLASNAGVGVASRGACSTACRVPRGCCQRDSDCGAAGEYCVNADCTSGQTTGVCKTRPRIATECWRNEDCPSVGGRPGTCDMPRICPCLAACILPDAPGRCR